MTERGISNPNELLRRISAHDFLRLGREHVAYIRPVQVDSREAFALHGADGTPLSVVPSLNAALVAAMNSDLDLISVH